MTDPLPIWLERLGDFVAIAAGIGGLITGAKGLALAKKADKKVSLMKALELRLELRKAVADLRLSANQAEGFLQQVDLDRIKLAALNNGLGQGSVVQWRRDFDKYSKDLARIRLIMPKDEGYKDLIEVQLEEKLVEVHKIRGQLNLLKSKYEDESRRTDFLRQKFDNAKKEDAADRRANRRLPPPPWSAQSFFDQNRP